MVDGSATGNYAFLLGVKDVSLIEARNGVRTPEQ